MQVQVLRPTPIGGRRSEDDRGRASFEPRLLLILDFLGPETGTGVLPYGYGSCTKAHGHLRDRG